MDANTQKLARKLDDPDLAARLVKAGYRNPAAIRRASDQELEAIPGIGKATRERLRRALPCRGRS